MSASDVLKQIKEEDIKYIDFRFTDTRGKEQHVTVPTSVVDADTFVEGKMFDGSSVAGWKGINESDMILMPEPETAVVDPFFQDKTLNIRCDIIEPSTMAGYERDPRSIAKRAEAYLKETGIGDTASLAQKMNFSYLTMFVFQLNLVALSLRLILKKPIGIQIRHMKLVTWGIVLA